jgi:tetratricopeptide (TPR) repeat protein
MRKMQSDDRPIIFFQIVLPVIVCLLVSLVPVPWRIAESQELAQAAIEAGNLPKAIASTLMVVDFFPWRTGLWQDLGFLSVAALDDRSAIRFFEEARGLHIISMDGQLSLATAYYRLGEYNRAEEIWKEIIQKENAPEGAFQALVTFYVNQEDLEGLYITYLEWSKQDPNNARILYETGCIQAILDPETSRTTLNRALTLLPNLEPAISPIIRASLLGLQSTDESYRLMQVGRAMANLGRWFLAKEAFSQAVELAPHFAEAWAFLGEARQQLGQDGLSELDRAQQLDSESIVVQALFAIYWSREGRTELATLYLEDIIFKQPDQAIWRIELANILAEKGDLQAALEQYRQAVKMEPGNALYWQFLAKFSSQNGFEPDQIAIPAARQALLLLPNDPAALDTMCWVFYNTGDLTTAERFCLRAIEEDSSFSLAYLHLGQIYLQWERYQEALSYLKSAFGLSLPSDETHQMANRLLQQYYFLMER